jgi:hypothetical protein
MTASSRPSANRAGAGLVVVGCAGEDAESLRDALGALRQDGLEVELCEGLDHDPKRLSDVIDRHDGRGLYVLCRSPRLGRERVEELREILLARHIPFARTLTVAVGGRGALADRIRAGLRRASARTSGPNRVVEGTPRLVATGRSRPVTTNATEDEEPTLVGRRDEAGAPEDYEIEPSRPLPPLARPVATTSPPPPARPSASPAPPATEISVVEAIDADLLTEETNASWSATATGGAELDLSDLDEGNTGPRRALRVDTTAVGTPPALITGNTVIGPAPAMITGDTVQGERLPRALREAASRGLGTASPASFGSASPELDPTTMPLPRLMPPAPGSSPPAPAPAAWAAAGPELSASASGPAYAASASGPAYAASASGPAYAASASAPNASFSSAAAAAASHDDVPASGRSKVLPWALGGVALLLLALVIALALSSGQPPSEVAASDASSDPQAPSATPTPSEPTPATDDEPADATPSAPPVYPVVTALQARKVRALDVLLIATARGKPGNFSAAEAYCGELDVDGVRGWRLPQIGELSSLAQANMIARGMFWSSTAADTFGDGHLAWNARRGYALPHSQDAVAVCVRGEASGS